MPRSRLFGAHHKDDVYYAAMSRPEPEPLPDLRKKYASNDFNICGNCQRPYNIKTEHLHRPLVWPEGGKIEMKYHLPELFYGPPTHSRFELMNETVRLIKQAGRLRTDDIRYNQLCLLISECIHILEQYRVLFAKHNRSRDLYCVECRSYDFYY